MKYDDPFFVHPDVRDGLVGEWECGENLVSPVIDLSGKGNNGVIDGAVRADGLGGHKVLSFDGIDDFVEIADNASLDITEAITIIALINPLDFGIDNKGRIITKTYATGYTFAVDNSNVVKGLYFASGNIGISQYSNENIIETGKWQQVAITYDKQNVKFYKNNVYVGGGVETASLGSNNDSLFIGNKDDLSRAFSGLIANIRIYNIALTLDQIKQLKIFFLKKYGLKPDFLENQ